MLVSNFVYCFEHFFIIMLFLKKACECAVLLKIMLIFAACKVG
jgi:hypothetical protein